MLRWIVVAALVLVPVAARGAPDEAPDKALEKDIQRVLPTEDEDLWLAIPWEQNIMRGRAESRRTGKPMLLWIMDGNVLGCT